MCLHGPSDTTTSRRKGPASVALDPVSTTVPLAPAEAVLSALTLDEKVALLVGVDMWATAAVPRLGLRPVVMSDGPAGVRGTDALSSSASFPAPSALGATWDATLAARVGEAFAAEARRHGVDVVLAPQVNLQRTPVGGRHFECLAEDPVLTASLAVPLVRAAQRHGVGMCVKHFVANDAETDRTRAVSRVDERTLREVYLAPFEALVAAGAWSVMGAYNGVDDGVEYAPVLEHRRLLTDVLKGEWGFDGVLVSDWVATKSVLGPVRAGMDLQMPGPDGPWGDGLAAAVAAGEVAEDELDDKVRRLLRPGGGLFFLEHGLSPVEKVATWQRRLDPMERRLAGGCELSRDIPAMVRRAGFEIDSIEEIDLPGPAVMRPWAHGFRGRASVAPA